jgi:hypothetical protein
LASGVDENASYNFGTIGIQHRGDKYPSDHIANLDQGLRIDRFDMSESMEPIPSRD